MAYYKAVAAGDIATLANWGTWNGSSWVAASSLPSASDDVWLNGFTMTTAGTSYAYLSLRNTVNVDLSINQGGVLQMTATGAQTFVCIADLYQGVDNLVNFTNTLSTVLRTMNFIGNCIMGATTSTVVLSNSGANSSQHQINVTGNITGNGVNANRFFYVYGAGSPHTGGVFTGIFVSAGLPLVTFVLNGTTAANKAVITGSVTASTASTCFILSTSTGKVDEITADLYASSVYPAISNVYRCQFTNSNLYSNGAVNAIAVNVLNQIFVVGTFTWWIPSAVGYVALSNNPASFYPAESDTRFGVTFEGGLKTGTAHIPPPASVALNVPTDNTVGTLVTATTPADFIAALKADDLGIRLEKCATTEEVDSTVASYNT